MSAMEVDSSVDAGVEEQKGEGKAMPAAAAAERSQKGKGEGDRNVMLHPVCCLLQLCSTFHVFCCVGDSCTLSSH